MRQIFRHQIRAVGLIDVAPVNFAKRIVNRSIMASLTGNLYVGLAAAIIIGGLVAAFHAWLVIRFKVDQVVSGVAINIFGAGPPHSSVHAFSKRTPTF